MSPANQRAHPRRSVPRLSSRSSARSPRCRTVPSWSRMRVPSTPPRPVLSAVAQTRRAIATARCAAAPSRSRRRIARRRSRPRVSLGCQSSPRPPSRSPLRFSPTRRPTQRRSCSNRRRPPPRRRLQPRRPSRSPFPRHNHRNHAPSPSRLHHRMVTPPSWLGMSSQSVRSFRSRSPLSLVRRSSRALGARAKTTGLLAFASTAAHRFRTTRPTLLASRPPRRRPLSPPSRRRRRSPCPRPRLALAQRG